MKLICVVAAMCSALAVVASSPACSPYYCYSTPKFDLSIAMPAIDAARVDDDTDAMPPLTLKSVADAAIETDTPRPNCLGAAH